MRLMICREDAVGDWFKACADCLGLPGSLHCLRHTRCTALVPPGVPFRDVQRLAGHCSITVTDPDAHHAHPGWGRRRLLQSPGGWRLCALIAQK